MAQIVLKTEGIKGPCIICNCYPRDETKEEHVYLPMFHALGVDVNWGEDCNVCQICAGVMADMMERRSQKEYITLAERHSKLLAEHAELKGQFEEQKERISAILKGRKAQKEQAAA